MNTTVPQELSGSDLAKLLGLSERSIRHLASEGKIIRADRGMYRLAESIQCLLADARKSNVSSALQREQEALAAAKRRAIEMRNAMLDNRLIELSEAEAVLDEMAGMWKAEINSLPARLTTNIDERRRFEDVVFDIFARISAKCGERAAELRDFGKIDSDKNRAKSRKLR